MLTLVLRMLGLAPRQTGKTGKRESAWGLLLIALALTLLAMSIGPDMVQAMTIIFSVLWPSAILALAGAYKLQHDKDMLMRGLGPAADKSSPASVKHWPDTPIDPRSDAGMAG